MFKHVCLLQRLGWHGEVHHSSQLIERLALARFLVKFSIDHLMHKGLIKHQITIEV